MDGARPGAAVDGATGQNVDDVDAGEVLTAGREQPAVRTTRVVGVLTAGGTGASVGSDHESDRPGGAAADRDTCDGGAGGGTADRHVPAVRAHRRRRRRAPGGGGARDAGAEAGRAAVRPRGHRARPRLRRARRRRAVRQAVGQARVRPARVRRRRPARHPLGAAGGHPGRDRDGHDRRALTDRGRARQGRRLPRSHHLQPRDGRDRGCCRDGRRRRPCPPRQRPPASLGGTGDAGGAA